MANLTKIAAVLDAMADYVDANERAKTSAVETARSARINKIASAHVNVYGEEMPDDVRQKLAKSDDAALDYIEDSLVKQSGAVESLGSGISQTETTIPTTTKQAAADAGEAFVNWIIS